MANSSSPARALAGNACILMATLFWGLNVSFTKALIPEWMTAQGIIVVRLVGGCALMWAASLFVGRGQKVIRSDWMPLALGGLVGLFAFIYLFVTALRYGNPIDISIIMTLPPVFVMLINAIFRGARPGWLEWAGVAVSMAGAATVIVAGGSGQTAHAGQRASDLLLGDLLAVASTLCYAFYLVITEGPSRRYRPTVMLRWVFLFAAVPALLLVPGMRDMPILRTTEAAPWLEIGFILLCPTFIAYFLVQPAVRLIGSELVSLYQYLLPVFATLSAVLMGLDRLGWIQVTAMAVIVCGMALTNLGKRRRVRSGK